MGCVCVCVWMCEYVRVSVRVSVYVCWENEMKNNNPNRIIPVKLIYLFSNTYILRQAGKVQNNLMQQMWNAWKDTRKVPLTTNSDPVRQPGAIPAPRRPQSTEALRFLLRRRSPECSPQTLCQEPRRKAVSRNKAWRIGGPKETESAPLTRKSELQTGRGLVTPETAPPHVSLGSGNSSRPADVTGVRPRRLGLRAETEAEAGPPALPLGHDSLGAE